MSRRKLIVGIDPGMHGNAPTRIAARWENEDRCWLESTIGPRPLMETIRAITDHLRQRCEPHYPDGLQPGDVTVVLDPIGIGAGVADCLRMYGFGIREVRQMTYAEMLAHLPPAAVSRRTPL